MRSAIGILILAVGFAAELPARASTELGIRGTRFTINRKPAFLLGISYYGGLGASPEHLSADIDRIQRSGFNWIRVWAAWSAFGGDVSVFDSAGRVRPEYMDRLERILRVCDRRGLVVDVTITRGGVFGVLDQRAHEIAAETLVTRLRVYRNWYLDLANERNIHDSRYVSFDELSRLQRLVRNLDPRRLLTASHGGDLSREDVHAYLSAAKVDFLCPHRPREENSAARPEETTRQLMRWMREEGRVIPVHYQEPFRRGYGAWSPAVADYLEDYKGARRGGAAGWCFHNGSQRDAKDGRPRRSFDLREQRLFDQLDAVELRVTDELSRDRSFRRSERQAHAPCG